MNILSRTYLLVMFTTFLTIRNLKGQEVQPRTLLRCIKPDSSVTRIHLNDSVLLNFTDEQFRWGSGIQPGKICLMREITEEKITVLCDNKLCPVWRKNIRSITRIDERETSPAVKKKGLNGLAIAGGIISLLALVIGTIALASIKPKRNTGFEIISDEEGIQLITFEAFFLGLIMFVIGAGSRYYGHEEKSRHGIEIPINDPGWHCDCPVEP